MAYNRKYTLAGTIIAAIAGVGAASAQCPPLPYTLTNGQPADATEVMANFTALQSCPNSGPGGSTNSVQVNGGTGTFNGVSLTNGQLLVGSTGNPPQAATLTAGSGIAVTNGAGSITISSSASTAFQREFGPFAPPAASIFTNIDTPNSITPTVTDVADVGLVYSVPVNSATFQSPGAYRAVPAGSWTLTVRAKYSVPVGQYPSFGIWLKDSAGKMLGAVIEANNGDTSLLAQRLTSNTAFSANPYAQAVAEAPTWFRVGYDGTNIRFSVSWDGQSWLAFYTETKTAFLNGSLSLVGIGGPQRISSASLFLSGSSIGATVTYWDLQ